MVADNERFWRKVEPQSNGCWLWTGATGRGYGLFTVGRLRPAHLLLYLDVIGPIPDGLQLDHLCRTRNCINPTHLEPVTGKVNVLRGVGITAVNARKTHCPRGHELSGDNLYISPPPKIARNCRACQREKDRRLSATLGRCIPNYLRTHCPQGHEYAGANLIIARNGGRICRTCERAKFKRWYDKHRRAA